MPKLIDYPRTSYTGAWELAEVTDDTGGKCAVETAARKMDRKVSGSFKAIIGSAVKFGLLTSKRDLLSTTTLFKRIKHAYDKQEEIVFHREAFLTPPLFTQICRKFRSRELPIQMLDVMLIREFGVEEINAQGVAKAFVDGARMVGLIDEHNIIADIDSLANKQTPRREIASPTPATNTFRPETTASIAVETATTPTTIFEADPFYTVPPETRPAISEPLTTDKPDAIASLFGFIDSPTEKSAEKINQLKSNSQTEPSTDRPTVAPVSQVTPPIQQATSLTNLAGYQVQISGPGVNTSLSITEEEDIILAIALLEKIRRQLKG